MKFLLIVVRFAFLVLAEELGCVSRPDADSRSRQNPDGLPTVR
jgi:hypothetical protein